MKLFLAGIMQGSHAGAVLHSQDYRGRIKALLREHLPEADIYDPRDDHAESIRYDEATGRRVFFHHNRMCGETDVLLAFVPEASMGTAIEMWEAYRHHAVVITISPLVYNWTVRFLSHVFYPSLEAFETDLAAGRLAQRIAEVRKRLEIGD